MRFAEDDLKMMIAEKFGVCPEDVNIVYHGVIPVNACVDVTKHYPKCIRKKDVSNLLVFVEHTKSMEDPFVKAMMRAIRNHDEAKKEPKIVKVPLSDLENKKSETYNPFSEMGLDTNGIAAMTDIANTIVNSVTKSMNGEAENTNTNAARDIELTSRTGEAENTNTNAARDIELTSRTAEVETKVNMKKSSESVPTNITVKRMRDIANDYGYTVIKAYLQETEKGVYSPIIEIKPSSIGVTCTSVDITNKCCPFEEIYIDGIGTCYVPIIDNITSKSDDITPQILFDSNHGMFVVSLNGITAVNGPMNAYLTSDIADKMANAAKACIALNQIDLSKLPKAHK